MLEQLLPYYERELASLRELSGEFAQRYPKIAGRLSLDGEQSEDPHVERLIESFAFLAARIHRKIDDEFPQITEAFMQVLYPHYTQPFPSCTILQMETDPHKPEITARHTIPRHHPALSPAIGGVQCRFRTCHDVDLYPLTLKTASIRLAQASEHLRRLAPQAAASIVLEFETQGGLSVAQISLQRLRFFLDGDPMLAHLLYELMLVRTLGIQVSDGSDGSMHAIRLPAAALAPAGFAKEESLLEHDERSFDGYRLLSEYFAFPDKFLFIDLNGLDAAPLQHAGNRLRVEIFLSSWSDSERHERLAQTISPNNFRLGCTPAVNLFKQAGEPIRLTHRKTAYPVVVDARRPLSYEVVAIDSVTGIEAARYGWANASFPADELEGEVLKMAEKISKLPLDVLQLNKRAIHRQMEAMGLRNGIRAGTELCALGTHTRSMANFVADIQSDGLTGALDRRDSKFGDYRTKS